MRISLVVGVVVIIAVLATMIDARRPKWHELSTNYKFERYIRDFGKRYSGSEFERRKALFADELNRVLEHNADKSATWRMGINRYSDYSVNEKRALLGHRAQQSANGIPFPGQSDAKPKELFPRTKDYRTVIPPVMTAVKDQGNCGDCWAQAATATIESSWARATGELFTLSSQQITDCTPLRGNCISCNGSTAHYGFDYVKSSGGLTEEWIYPFQSYNASMPKCRDSQLDSIPASRVVNISGYYQVKPNDEDALVQAINELGPIAIGVNAFPWIPYETGVLTNCAYKNSTMFNVTTPYELDHAVVVAGYGFDRDTQMNYWVVRNSWNPTWGEAGYIRLHRAPTVPCGWAYGGGCFPSNSSTNTFKAWTCGCSGIMSDPTFPISDVTPQ